EITVVLPALTRGLPLLAQREDEARLAKVLDAGEAVHCEVDGAIMRQFAGFRKRLERRLRRLRPQPDLRARVAESLRDRLDLPATGVESGQDVATAGPGLLPVNRVARGQEHSIGRDAPRLPLSDQPQHSQGWRVRQGVVLDEVARAVGAGLLGFEQLE